MSVITPHRKTSLTMQKATAPAAHEHPLDSSELLRKWGFTESHCAKCNVSNSELGGLLMQCGTCKKKYYCTMDCWNEDLVEHKKVCPTVVALKRGPTRADRFPEKSVPNGSKN